MLDLWHHAVAPCIMVIMVKARFTARCGRCREWITPGMALSRDYGAPWHTSCVITYKKHRRELALAASGARR